MIRDAAGGDAIAIHIVHETAFGSDGEAKLVAALNADGDALASLVAQIEGATVGHVMFSRMTVEADDEPLAGAALAPVAVLPAYQGVGLGSALIRAGLERLPALGVKISFVLGDPAYYTRFGYSSDLAARFASPYAGPHWMALRFGDAPAPRAGRAAHARAFAALG